MTVVARFSVPAEQFPLGEVTSAVPDAPVRLESLVPTGGAVFPYFWVPTDEASAVEAALEESSIAEHVTTVDEVEAETLFRVTWSVEVNGVVEALHRVDGVLLEAWGASDEWTLRIRFDDREDVSAFYRACVDAGITPTLDELHSQPTGTTETLGNLTDAQREALLTALDAGYYAVPRGVTLQDLAERLGISDTALSQRLRRGLATVLSSTLRPASTPPDAGD